MPLLNYTKLLGEPTLVAGEPMEGIEEEKHTVVKVEHKHTQCEQTQASTPKTTCLKTRGGGVFSHVDISIQNEALD